MEKMIDICFTGKDFSKLDESVYKAKISNTDEEVFFSYEEKRIILDKFLESIQKDINDGKLTVCRSSYNSNKKDKIKLYDKDYKEGYFAGIVGVVSKEIDIPKVEIHSNSNYDVDENYRFKVKVEIKSRLDVNENGDSAKPYFLSTMLLKDNIKLNDDTIPSSEDEIFDVLLLFWFKEQLQTAYLKGLYRTYRKFEKNDERIKGSIDIARHIRMNSGQNNGRIAYSFRENTVNNYLNHLIVASYKILKKKYPDLMLENFDSNFELKGIIDNLIREIGYLNDISDKLIFKNIKSINHPFYTEYEEIRKTCLRILRNEGISIFDGENGQETNGILFYLPDLWEDYVYDVINKTKMDVQNTTIKVTPQKEQRIFGIKKDNNYEFKQKTYPDYVFETKESDSLFMIMDAKFKPKWEDVINGSSISDVLQDYDKCLRDMVSINAHATGVIFPVLSTKDLLNNYNLDRIEHQISKENPIDCFYTLPILIPYILDESYSEWKGKLEENEKIAMELLKSILEKEYLFYSKINEYMKEMQKQRENLKEYIESSVSSKTP